MRIASHSSTLSAALVVAVLAWRAAAAPLPDDWREHGAGVEAEASWLSTDGATKIEARCDRAAPRILLHVRPSPPQAGVQAIALIADAVSMRYPVERVGASDDAAYVAKIALDAPILDRILVARSFRIDAGGRTTLTGVPGSALARVVRACRTLHWPRDPRVMP